MLGRNLITSAAGNAAEIDKTWDIEYAFFDGSGQNFLFLGNEETKPTSGAFKTDGTKMYIVGDEAEVNEYSLSTAWDIGSASYSQTFSVSSQDSRPQTIRFKPDGTKMYHAGAINDKVYEYDLSTAWDISTASYNQNFSIATQETVPMGMFFKTDGTRMYVVGLGSDAVNEYTLSTAWDISTASYSQNFSVSSQDTSPNGLFFEDDGTTMYISGDSGNDINEYSLSTAWDVSTASYTRNFSISSQSQQPKDIFFKGDGTKMFVFDRDKYAFQYSLSTAWNISSLSYSEPTTEIKNVSSQDANPFGVFFKSDGSKMYICGYSTIDIYEYNLSTNWAISTASLNQSFAVNLQEVSPNEVVFKTDGTKMYIVGSSGDEVNEYDLSTAWDISTASFNQNFSVNTQDGSMQGLFFKPDGTKMYTCGTVNDEVYEYNLSTAWDISTASFYQDTNMGTQDGSPTQIFFKSDGTRMYMIGTQYDRLYQYDLSTAWDVSSLTYDTNIELSFWDTNVHSVFFKPEGDKFFFVGSAKDNVVAFTIPTS